MMLPNNWATQVEILAAALCTDCQYIFAAPQKQQVHFIGIL